MPALHAAVEKVQFPSSQLVFQVLFGRFEACISASEKLAIQLNRAVFLLAWERVREAGVNYLSEAEKYPFRFGNITSRDPYFLLMRSSRNFRLVSLTFLNFPHESTKHQRVAPHLGGWSAFVVEQCAYFRAAKAAG